MRVLGKLNGLNPRSLGPFHSRVALGTKSISGFMLASSPRANGMVNRVIIRRSTPIEHRMEFRLRERLLWIYSSVVAGSVAETPRIGISEKQV